MKKFLTSIFCSSVLWGGAVSFGFYALIRRGVIHDELIVRYTSGHPVEYVTVVLFFIGMVSLVFKFLGLCRARHAMSLGPIFPPVKSEKEEVIRADDYLETLKKARVIRGDSLHISRLRRALLFLKSSGRADELDQELRCLADEDAMAVEADYGMVRMFIWAIPILGFLGTVIGITAALGNLNLTELEATGKLLASGLKIAFDTTALALSLVFVLYFSLFFVQRSETKLFARVDRLVDRELKGRFVPSPSPLEQDELKASRKILKSMVESFDNIMRRQTEIWENAMVETASQGAKVIQKGSEQIQMTLRGALSESVTQHARLMIQGEEKLLNETLSPYAQITRDNIGKMNDLHGQMIEETKVIREVLHANSEIARLEDRLNQNLKALAEAGNFAEMVNSLAAAIHLLNGKLKGTSFAAAPEVSRLTGLVERAEETFDHSAEVFDQSRSAGRNNPLRSEEFSETESESRGKGRSASHESIAECYTFPIPPARAPQKSGIFSQKTKRNKSA